MDEQLLMTAVKKLLLYLSKNKPNIIWEMCEERKNDRLAYLENHKENYYLGNNERADLIMCCDFLTECFMQSDNKLEWKEKLLDIMLLKGDDYLSKYDGLFDTMVESRFEIREEDSSNIEIQLNRQYRNYFDSVRSDDVLQSIFVLISYEGKDSDSYFPLHRGFTEFCGVDSLEKTIEKRLNMGESFSECRFVKKGIKKLRQLIAEEINIDDELENKFGTESLSIAIADIILHTNGCSREVPALNTSTCYGIESKYFTPFILYGYEKFVLDLSDGFDDYKKIIHIMDEAIERTCMAAILNKALYDVSDEMFAQKPVGVLATLPSFEKKEEITPNRILRFVREIDIPTLVVSCIWNAAFALMKDKIIENSIDAFRYKITHDESKIKEAQNNEIKANNKLAAAKKEIENLKTTNSKLQKRMDMVKESCEAVFKKEQQADKNTIAEMDRTIRKQQREIEKLKMQLENERNKNENHENVPVIIPEASVVKKCDFSKRYMFLCGHKILAGRIAEAFPNSINSECYNITVKNARTIDAVVAITSEISHNEYDRIKKQCIMHEIPFIHCSSVNIEKIADKIAEVL